MKPIFKFIWAFLFVLTSSLFTAMSIPVFQMHANWPPQKILLDFKVGQRTNDSTGQLSISNSVIQQSIIPIITLLKNTTVTSDNSILLVSRNTVYLQFNVTDTSGAKSYIAIQLNENASGEFLFHPGVGKELHISRNSVNSAGCLFIREMGRITKTSCSGDPGKHFIHFSM